MELGNYKFVRKDYSKWYKRWYYNFIEYTKIAIRLLTVGSIGVIYSAIFFFAGQYSSPVHVTAEQVNLDKLPQKIEQMKTDLVNDIANKENKSNIPAISDDNKAKSLPIKDKVSYGCMQYKISTVQLHYRTLYGNNLSDVEAATLAIDCSKAKDLAKEAIFKIQGAIWNWSVATKEMGDKVEFIRNLEK